MDDLISVILPVYNVELYLDRCMQSVLNQTYKNLDIILVDDKSTDRSNAMCLEYQKDPRVVVVHGENKGLSGARNSGLDVAKGKYVVFIDSDDYVKTDMIENLHHVMKSTDADTVIGGFCRVIANNIIEKRNPFSGILIEGTENIKAQVLKRMLGYDGIDQLDMSVWKILFSMDLIQNNHLRFPDRKYICEDIIFDFDYYPLSQKIAMSDDTGYYYCLNEESLSQGYVKNKIERLRFQSLEMRKLAEAAGFDDNAFLRIDYFFLGNCIHHMKIMVSGHKTIGKKACIREFKSICSNEDIRNVRWRELKACFCGKDRIPVALVRMQKIRLLYAYLVCLTKLRNIIRKS